MAKPSYNKQTRFMPAGVKINLVITLTFIWGRDSLFKVLFQQRSVCRWADASTKAQQLYRYIQDFFYSQKRTAWMCGLKLRKGKKKPCKVGLYGLSPRIFVLIRMNLKIMLIHVIQRLHMQKLFSGKIYLMNMEKVERIVLQRKK